jgi:hypothetical protein
MLLPAPSKLRARCCPYKWFGMVLTGPFLRQGELKTRRYKNKKNLGADGRPSRLRAR